MVIHNVSQEVTTYTMHTSFATTALNCLATRLVDARLFKVSEICTQRARGSIFVIGASQSRAWQIFKCAIFFSLLLFVTLYFSTIVLLLTVVKLWGNAGERRSPSIFGGGTPFP